MRQQLKCSERIRDLYAGAGTSGSGRLSLDEFEKLLLDKRAKAWLSELGLDDEAAVNIFRLVHDGNGHLTLDEFLGGVFKLKDATKAIDMLVLQQETKMSRHMLSNFQHQLEDLTFLCQQIAQGMSISDMQQRAPKVAHKASKTATFKS